MTPEKSATKQITIRPNGTRRVTIQTTDVSLTDQSMKKATDINNILKQYSTQGITPTQITDPKFYQDVSNVPEFNDAFNIVNRSFEEFKLLHPDLRKLMDNNPANMAKFISNPDNFDILVKYKVLTPRKEVKVDPITSDDPPPVGKKTQKEAKKDD